MANTYHANFRNTDPRPSRRNTSITFAAPDDATATAIVGELANWTTGQLTSLTKCVDGTGKPNIGSVPLGTRCTAIAIVQDSAGNVGSVRFRNVIKTPTCEAAVEALVTGAAYIDASYTITALDTPPILPASGLGITVCRTVSLVNKS